MKTLVPGLLGLRLSSPVLSVLRLSPLILSVLLLGCGGDGSDPLDVPDPPSYSPVPCFYPDARCWEDVPLGEGLLLPVYRTHPIRARDTTVVRVVIVVHGAARDPDAYFDTMLDATSWAGYWTGTMVIAPHFQTKSDGPNQGEATWTSNGWKRGDQSDLQPGTGATISSYAAMDQLLRLLADTLSFPSLESVVVTGHSAGGQFAHRFAAASQVEDETGHLRFRYVVANPSTFLFIGPQRPSASGSEFEVPTPGSCPDYNDWHYGLENRNPYALRLSQEEIRTRLLTRDLVYLAGTADLGTASLDMSCGAMLQGERRYNRALNVFQFLNTFFPSHHSQFMEVPGVAHSSRNMYTSGPGGAALFQW